MAQEEAQEFTIPVPYGHIAGKVWRPSAGSAVLCLHGWQDNAGTFDHLAPLLPDHLCVVAIDFPGHGLSSHKPRGFSSNFIEYLISIDTVVRFFGWSQLILMGHSMGGALAMLYAGTRPSLVHSVVLLDMVKPFHVEPKAMPAQTERALDALLVIEQKLEGPKPAYTAEDLFRRAMKSHEKALDEAGVRTLLKRGARRLPSGLYEFSYDLQIRCPSLLSMTREQQAEYARRLRCRLLLVQAADGLSRDSQDHIDAFLQIYREHCREFEHVTVPGGHHVHLATPQLVAPHVCRFLAPAALPRNNCRPSDGAGNGTGTGTGSGSDSASNGASTGTGSGNDGASNGTGTGSGNDGAANVPGSGNDGTANGTGSGNDGAANGTGSGNDGAANVPGSSNDGAGNGTGSSNDGTGTGGEATGTVTYVTEALKKPF